MASTPLEESIQTHAGQCVKCGLCLPHCPTYAVTENECESPRGRIALLDALAKKQISLTDKTRLYLDHCLTCRACEIVCPAQVSYGELIDQGRQLITEQTPLPLAKILTAITKHRWLRRLLANLLFIYQRSGLQYLLRKSGLLKALGLQRAEALLPFTIARNGWRPSYPAQSNEQGHVTLFTGCISSIVDRSTLKAAIKVLTACGYNVHIPATQQCCGALHQHAGFNKQALAFAEQNVTAFKPFSINPIITLATGCSAMLQEYKAFTQKIIDINQFLAHITWPEDLKLQPLPKQAVIHTPCTLRNVLKQPEAPLQLLHKIPALEITTLPDNTYCCGAAGQNVLQHPTMADALLEQIVKQIIPLNPDYLITTNIGCALHIQKGLTENHCKTRVLHPIVLIAQQLIR